MARQNHELWIQEMITDITQIRRLLLKYRVYCFIIICTNTYGSEFTDRIKNQLSGSIEINQG